MKIFQTVRRQYEIVGIRSPHSLVDINTFNKLSIVNFCFLSYGCLIFSQFVYIFRVANGFMDYIVCISSTSSSVILFVCFAAIVFRKTTLFECIDNMEKVINSRLKYPKSEAFLMKANRQVERLSEIIFIFVMKFALQLVILPKSIGSFCVYFLTDTSGVDAFQLPFPMWFPFDTTNPIGYFIAVSLEYIILGCEFFIAACTLSLGIGAFWFAIAATKEFHRFQPILNEKAQTNQFNELKILFIELIDGHGIVIQVEHKFSDIFQPIIMSELTWSLFAISGAMFIIQMITTHQGDFMPLLLLIINGINGLATVFVICEVGQRMADAFDEVNVTMEQIDWYLFPPELKRMLPMILAIVQKPVSLECFGSIICGRDVFKKIINRAYSYFSVLCQLGD